MIDLNAQEAPNLVQAVDLLLLLDGLVLEPQLLRLGLGDSLRELRRLGLSVRLLRLHPFLPVLHLLKGTGGRSVWDDPVGSVSLALEVEVGLGAHLGQGTLQHVAFAHVGERSVGRHKFTCLHAADRRFLLLGSSRARPRALSIRAFLHAFPRVCPLLLLLYALPGRGPLLLFVLLLSEPLLGRTLRFLAVKWPFRALSGGLPVLFVRIWR